MLLTFFRIFALLRFDLNFERLGGGLKVMDVQNMDVQTLAK